MATLMELISGAPDDTPGVGTDGLETLLPLLLAQGAAASEPTGDEGTMGMLAAMQASPFYSGQTSHSGVGQISESILPLITGLMAGKQAERQAEQASLAQVLKLVTTMNELKAAGTKAKHAEAKETRAESKEAREAALFTQAQEALGTALGASNGKLSVKDIKLTPSGPTVTMSDPSVRSSRERENEAFGRGIGQGMQQSDILIQKGGGAIYGPPDPVTGERRVQPLPDPKAMTTAAKEYEDAAVFEQWADTFESATDAAGPGGVGFTGRLENALAGAGSQADGLINMTRRLLLQTPKDSSLVDSDLFKKLMGPTNTPAARFDAARAAIVFQAAVALGQTGHALSDSDRKAIERTIGPEWLTTPESVHARMGILRELIGSRKQAALRRSVAAINPTGNVMTGTFLPPDYLPRPSLGFDENANRVAAGLAIKGVPEAAIPDMTAELLRSSGVLPEAPK